MAALIRALDIAEQQVLIDFFGDPGGFWWHARILLVKTSQPGVWVVTSPDWETQRCNLNDHRVVPMLRNGPIPAGYEHLAYVFDNPPDAGELARVRREGAELAAILGLPSELSAPQAALGDWRIADTSHSEFGEAIPDQVAADPQQFVSPPAAGSEKYPVALAMVDRCWVSVARVRSEDLSVWKYELVTATGHDDRITGDERDEVSGKRSTTFADTFSYLSEPKAPVFPLLGKRVLLEYARVLRSNGMDWMTHHMDFVHKSGVSTTSGSARAHRKVSEALQSLQTVDQCNLPALVACEQLCRYLVQIESAVTRNPRCPDYSDLEVISGSTLNAHGALVLPEYSQYVAQVQRDEAFVLKQRRQWAEEQANMSSSAYSSKNQSDPDKDNRQRPPRGRGGRGGRRGGRGGRPGGADAAQAADQG